MKHLRLIVIAAALTTLSSAAPAPAQTPAAKDAPAAAAATDTPEQAVLKLESALNQAIIKADVAALDKILADDWFVKTEARMATKGQLLDALKTNGSQWGSIKDEGLDVHVYGNTVIVRGLSVRRLVGGDADTRISFTRAYVKRPSGWQLAAMHAAVLD